MIAMKLVLAAVVGIALGAGCEKKGSGGDTKTTSSSADRCPHDIKPDKCPFCHPEMVEAEGFCAEHGVAEALCYQCRPYLTAAFRAKGDWCEAHKAPDSQCVECHPELKDKMQPGAGHGKAEGQG